MFAARVDRSEELRSPDNRVLDWQGSFTGIKMVTGSID